MTPTIPPRRIHFTRRVRWSLSLACFLPIALGMPSASQAIGDGAAQGATSSEQIVYPMNAETWTTEHAISWAGNTPASASFKRYEGMPNGTMTLNEGITSLKTGGFSEGQIDYDIKPLGYDDAGLVFHRHGEEDGEFVYIRANPDCPAADDCVQYTPINHGHMQWNIYPNYQGPAPVTASGWNHVSVRVAGRTMLVYFNHATEPSIVVPVLRGGASNGGIAFKGPAIYANLILRPNARPDVRNVTAEPVSPGTVTNWLAAEPTAHDRARPLSAREIPSAHAWSAIDVEPTGLVNLGRAFGAGRAPSLSMAWLKTEITASKPVRKTIHFGFAMQGSVFLNGHLVYSGNNPYYPSTARLSVEGRIQFDNAAIPLDLRQGRNEIVFAIGNDWRTDLPDPTPSQYGWAAEGRFDNLDGIEMINGAGVRPREPLR